MLLQHILLCKYLKCTYSMCNEVTQYFVCLLDLFSLVFRIRWGQKPAAMPPTKPVLVLVLVFSFSFSFSFYILFVMRLIFSCRPNVSVSTSELDAISLTYILLISILLSVCSMHTLFCMRTCAQTKARPAHKAKNRIELQIK